RGGGTGPCTYVLRTGDCAGEQCGGPHSTQRCFGRLTDAWRHQFPDATEIPRWGDLSRTGVAIFDLDYDAILAAMYAVSYSAEGDCYLCVPPDPGIEAPALGTGDAAALGASASAAPGAGESALSGTSSAQAFHTFTLDSGASRSFFRDHTTLTPLSRPDAVSLADPSGGPVLASFSTVLPCPAAPSGTLSGASASAAPGAGESALSGTSSAQAFHTFTLDSGASRSFFRDHTTLTPLSRPVAVSLADPSGGPVLASFSTVLPCPAAPSGTLSGLYLPSFSTNLVSGADLQDQGVDQVTPAGQRVTHCTCARTGRHLATFTRRPGSSLYTLTTASPPVAESGQVAPSSQVFAAASRSGPETAPCSCRLLSHQTLLWHHRLGHPSLPHLRGMASRVLRADPHSSEFPPTEAPLQTLHMDVWGPARVRGQGHERYFLLVVEDYSRYTTVFPLRSKGDATEVLINWIRAARLRLRESFDSDFPVLRLHSDRGGEFSSARLGAFCHAQGIRQTFTLPASPQQNGIAEHRIGMVMDVARTSMIHAAAPHPRVSLPETSPTLLWTGKVGDASGFRVWGSRAFVRDLSADKLSPRAVPCVFLGFPPDAPGWQFYHPTSRRFLSSQDVTFDESVPYYRLVPYRTASLPPPPLFLAPGPPPVDPLPPQGPAPSGVSQVDAVEPVEVAVDSGAATGAEPRVVRALAAQELRWLTYLLTPSLNSAAPVQPGHADASWADDQATQRSSQGYTFSLGSGSVSWRSTRSSSVLSSSCEAEIYAGAMAAQELHWLTYLLTDLGEQPRSPPVLYVDNKAMLALCREHRLEHRTKHIARLLSPARPSGGALSRPRLRLPHWNSAGDASDQQSGSSQPHWTLLVNCSGRLCGDFVIHPELALLCLTGLVTSCSTPLCLWGFSYLYPTHLLVHPFLVILTQGSVGVAWRSAPTKLHLCGAIHVPCWLIPSTWIASSACRFLPLTRAASNSFRALPL
ncbi:unnamed protein product, partial [Closterium sp. NIES-54]